MRPPIRPWKIVMRHEDAPRGARKWRVAREAAPEGVVGGVGSHVGVARRRHHLTARGGRSPRGGLISQTRGGLISQTRGVSSAKQAGVISRPLLEPTTGRIQTHHRPDSNRSPAGFEPIPERFRNPHPSFLGRWAEPAGVSNSSANKRRRRPQPGGSLGPAPRPPHNSN